MTFTRKDIQMRFIPAVQDEGNCWEMKLGGAVQWTNFGGVRSRPPRRDSQDQFVARINRENEIAKELEGKR